MVPFQEYQRSRLDLGGGAQAIFWPLDLDPTTSSCKPSLLFSARPPPPLARIPFFLTRCSALLTPQPRRLLPPPPSSSSARRTGQSPRRVICRPSDCQGAKPKNYMPYISERREYTFGVFNRQNGQIMALPAYTLAPSTGYFTSTYTQAMASSADPKPPQPYVVEDCRGVLQVLSDGTVVRPPVLPFPVGDDHDDGGVEWRDAVYDAGRGLGLRMYRPTTAAGGQREKLPVLAYFHGGGFCIGSYTWPNFHAGCLRLAGELPAVVLSFDYRLAPEHRLPAAHEDAAAALLWLRDQLRSDPWLAEAANPAQVFVTGESAGGNLAHHMAVRFGTAGLAPVKIAGYILLMPAFITEQPSRSELDTPATAMLTREIADRYNRLSLPAGASRGHPLYNPFSPESPSLDTVDVGRMVVVAAAGDLLRDRNVEYAERLKAAGKDVELVVVDGEEHAFFGTKPLSSATGELVGILRRFTAAGAAVPA